MVAAAIIDSRMRGARRSCILQVPRLCVVVDLNGHLLSPTRLHQNVRASPRNRPSPSPIVDRGTQRTSSAPVTARRPRAPAGVITTYRDLLTTTRGGWRPEEPPQSGSGDSIIPEVLRDDGNRLRPSGSAGITIKGPAPQGHSAKEPGDRAAGMSAANHIRAASPRTGRWWGCSRPSFWRSTTKTT
jgi:hypothetical protein